jgi:hypothetical protein
VEYDWRKRPPTDFYPTPPDVTQALLDFLQIEKAAKIWECASGDGRMSRVLEANGYSVKSTDIQTGTNFVLQEPDDSIDWIITNPPFVMAEEFIRHAAAMPLGGFAFLLKSQYWHSASRVKLFNQIKPTFVLPLTWRPDFLFGEKSGSPTMEVLWTVWIDGQEPGEFPVYEPLSRPRMSGELFNGEPT